MSNENSHSAQNSVPRLERIIDAAPRYFARLHEGDMRRRDTGAAFVKLSDLGYSGVAQLTEDAGKNEHGMAVAHDSRDRKDRVLQLLRSPCDPQTTQQMGDSVSTLLRVRKESETLRLLMVPLAVVVDDRGQAVALMFSSPFHVTRTLPKLIAPPVPEIKLDETTLVSLACVATIVVDELHKRGVTHGNLTASSLFLDMEFEIMLSGVRLDLQQSRVTAEKVADRAHHDAMMLSNVLYSLLVPTNERSTSAMTFPLNIHPSVPHVVSLLRAADPHTVHKFMSWSRAFVEEILLCLQGAGHQHLPSSLVDFDGATRFRGHSTARLRSRRPPLDATGSASREYPQPQRLSTDWSSTASPLRCSVAGSRFLDASLAKRGDLVIVAMKTHVSTAFAWRVGTIVDVKPEANVLVIVAARTDPVEVVVADEFVYPLSERLVEAIEQRR